MGKFLAVQDFKKAVSEKREQARARRELVKARYRPRPVKSPSQPDEPEPRRKPGGLIVDGGARRGTVWDGRQGSFNSFAAWHTLSENTRPSEPDKDEEQDEKQLGEDNGIDHGIVRNFQGYEGERRTLKWDRETKEYWGTSTVRDQSSTQCVVDWLSAGNAPTILPWKPHGKPEWRDGEAKREADRLRKRDARGDPDAAEQLERLKRIALVIPPYKPRGDRRPDAHSIKGDPAFWDFEDRFLEQLTKGQLWGDAFVVGREGRAWVETDGNEDPDLDGSGAGHAQRASMHRFVWPETNTLDRLFGQETDEAKLRDDALRHATGDAKRQWAEFERAWLDALKEYREDEKKERDEWRKLVGKG